jgi:hypothetical protein
MRRRRERRRRRRREKEGGGGGGGTRHQAPSHQAPGPKRRNEQPTHRRDY